MPSAIALIGARAGSERVPGKNVRRLAGHPLLAYAIETARQSEVFDRIVVSTDSERIAQVARWYGADVPFLRPDEYSTSTSPDIEWIAWTLPQLEERYDLFAIVRATNPFRGPDVIRRGLDQLLATPEADSIRAVERVKQHPGKMWVVDEVDRLMRPLLDQSHLDVAWHAGQYQALPPVYVQNSALEIAWTRVVEATGTREGRVLAPFFTEGFEGLNIDDEDDFARAERLVADGRARLVDVAARAVSWRAVTDPAGHRPWSRPRCVLALWRGHRLRRDVAHRGNDVVARHPVPQRDAGRARVPGARRDTKDDPHRRVEPGDALAPRPHLPRGRRLRLAARVPRRRTRGPDGPRCAVRSAPLGGGGARRGRPPCCPTRSSSPHLVVPSRARGRSAAALAKRLGARPGIAVAATSVVLLAPVNHWWSLGPLGVLAPPLPRPRSSPSPLSTGGGRRGADVLCLCAFAVAALCVAKAGLGYAPWTIPLSLAVFVPTLAAALARAVAVSRSSASAASSSPASRSRA